MKIFGGRNIKIESLEPQLSPKFKSIEKTVKLFLSRKRSLFESREIIIRTMYDAVEVLQSDRFQNPKPVLVSLKALIPTIDHDLFEYMQLMGLDYVIQIYEDTYNVKYFINFVAVILLGIFQLAIGFMLLQTGNVIIADLFGFEGTSDIIYALMTLRSGVFRWKDYRNHKITSAVITASLIGTTLQITRLARYYQFNRVIEVLDPVIASSRSVASAPTNSLVRAFGSHIINKSGRAISYAGVSMGVDYVVSNQLNTLPEGLANALRDKLTSE